MLSKEGIAQAFSRAAATYDGVSDFQKETGLRLIASILAENPSANMVLDAGIGTGAIAQELAIKLNTNIYGCDLSWGMTSFAKTSARCLYVIQADVEALPYKKENFDIVFSNLTYQWVHDFNSAFSEVKKVLKRNGKFYFSIVIRGSLKELYSTIADVVKKNYDEDFPPEANFIKLKLKETGLKTVWFNEQTIKKHYESAYQLMWALRNSGSNKIAENNIFDMGKRQLFFRVVDLYNRNFSENGKVFATYKVLMGCAEKP